MYCTVCYKFVTRVRFINFQVPSKIKKSKEKEWNERLNTLKEQIDYWINPENKTDKTVEVIQLFYDDVVPDINC